MLPEYINSTRVQVVAATAVATMQAAPLWAGPPAAVSAAGGAPACNLGFVMQQQQQTQWCWSAVSVSTSLFYNPASTWTQCTLANQQLGQTTCCLNGSSTACNRPWQLDQALQATGNLTNWSAGAAGFATVEQEINAGRPLAARIAWPKGGGHFVTLDGYDTAGGQYLSVKDPFYGTSTYPYASFQSAYRGSGSWSHSYYTH